MVICRERTVTGFRQLRDVDRPGTPPAPSSLSISLQSQSFFLGGLAVTSRYAPEVLLGSAKQASLSRYPVPESGNLSAAGFGNLTVINPDGLIHLEKGSVLDAGLGGSLTLQGANLDLEGKLLAPGGKISLTADLVPLDLRQVAPIDPVKNDPKSLLGLYEIKETGEKVYQFGAAGGDGITILHSDMTRENYGVIETVSPDALRPATTGSIILHGSTLLSVAGLVTSDAISSSRESRAQCTRSRWRGAFALRIQRLVGRCGSRRSRWCQPVGQGCGDLWERREDFPFPVASAAP